MGRPGRPKVYKEKRIPINLHLPAVLVDKLDEIAFEQGITRTELINSILVQADMEEALTLSKNLKEMRDTIRELMNMNKKYEDKLKRFLDKQTVLDFYAEIEKDELLESWLKNIDLNKIIASRYDIIGRSLKYNAPTLDILIDRLYNNFELWLLEQGKVIKNKQIIKYLLKKELLEKDKEFRQKHNIA